MPDREASLEAAALDLCRAGRRVARAGLIAGRAGNLSLRAGDTILITPRGTNKARLRTRDIVRTPLETPAPEVAGASVEYAMHRACYLARPPGGPVGAVVHTHAPALTALGLLGLDLSALPEAAANIGGLAVVPFHASGSAALARAVGDAIAGGAGVVVLAGHGVTAVGADLDEALDRMDLAELSAETVLRARPR